MQETLNQDRTPNEGMVQNLLTLSELNRPLRSRRKGRQEEILSSAGKMRKPKGLPPVVPPVVPTIGEIDSTRQGGAMFLESSFFPAFQNFFLGVLRALSDHRERAVKQFFRSRKSVNQFFRENEPSPNEAMHFFREIRELYRETDQRFKDTEQRFKDTDAKFKDTDAKFKDTDAKFKDTERLIRTQSKEINRLERLFTSQWGKLIESLVEGDLVNILQRFGLQVENTSTRLRGRTAMGRNYEFDILALDHDGEILVVVEVRTTLCPEDVNDFLDKLSQFKTWLPRYTDNTIHGAVAYLQADASAVTMAERRGLLVIRATGDSAAIVNSRGFKPKAW
jgi:predicted GIY-YIG superfamily endonuclease